MLSLLSAWLPASRPLGGLVPTPSSLHHLMQRACALVDKPAALQHVINSLQQAVPSCMSHEACSTPTSSNLCQVHSVRAVPGLSCAYQDTRGIQGGSWSRDNHWTFVHNGSHSSFYSSTRQYCSAKLASPFSTQRLSIRCVGPDFSQSVTLKRYRLPGFSSERDPGTHPTSPASLQADPYLNWAVQVVVRLRSQGHAAYFAGGWVRDALLCRPSADIDIVTSANVLQELPLLFSGYKIRQMQRSTARMDHGGMSLEVAQFKGARKLPDLDSLYYDACLRDFTINALYYDPVEHQVLDFVDGVDHLQQQVLQLPPYPISNLNMPSTVIAADPLRVVRAVRFAVSMGMRMSDALRDQIRIHGPKCRFENQQGAGSVGNRRLFKEFTKLCKTSPPGDSSATAGSAFEMMAELGLLEALFPDIVIPDPATCRDLQLVLNQAAGGMDILTRQGPDAGPPPAMRVLMLIDPRHGLASKQVINSVNAYMFQHLGAVWDNQLFSDAELITDLLTEVRFSQEGQPAPGLAPLPDSSHLEASLTHNPHLEPWGVLISMKVYPLLEAWILAWLDPKEQRLWHEAIGVIQHATVGFAAPPAV